MESRGYSDLYRNSSEELFLKSLMESSVGMPSMEMLGFKNISQPFRVDSEELFDSWLNNGEINGHNSTSIAHRTRKASRRISTELPPLSQQHGTADKKEGGDDSMLQQNLSMLDDLSNVPNQQSNRNTMEKGIQASNLYLAKAWFNSSQPMTRSRSSELRRRYAAMQNNQISFGAEVTQHATGQARTKQEFQTTTNFCDITIGEIPNQLRTFMSPSNSSTSHLSTPPVKVDTVSSVVSMLRGTLERKKLGSQSDNGMVDSGSFELHGAMGATPNTSSDQQAINQILGSPRTFQVPSTIQVKETGNLQMLEGSVDVDIDGLIPQNQLQSSLVSREPSQSESSAAALSTGFEVCDGSAISGQTISVCESSRKPIANGEHMSKPKDIREKIFYNNVKDERKRGNLVRMGSVTSGVSVDSGDPTKKRRVERSRKMAEAKERNSTPIVPSDMQSILKRCENLEREVRSLKLNLSFMNRKDSEQTKQIEGLEKQNEDLIEEKERLLEEIERIIS
ncbi:hypothetical protein QJS04_geneDACA012224 [Acorus gramineus]|uniref:Protein CYCLOPS n=1 Tax=Acorus gramineus TaxID=55184 RepID=A0AAV9B9W6_ACOGR|nr:hypothetical protein QJS04_geneDACA012224 [Acorus gramineus]